MTTLNIKMDSANYPSVEVDGDLIPLSLEVMNVVSPSPMNEEFYSSESDFLFSAKEEQKKIDDKNNKIDSDEVREARITKLLNAVKFSKEFLSV